MSASSSITLTPAVDYRILGTLEVAANGEPVDLGRPKQRALLALLLLHANQPVALDRVLDLLWGEDPPDRAAGDLQVHVSRLRRTLEPSRPTRAPSQVLLTVAGGYLLRVGPDDLDADRFETLADRGHRLLACGYPVPARSALVDALDLWRGPALAEFSYEPFAHPDATRLEERRMLAVEDRYEAELAVGNHAEAVAALEVLVGQDGLRERRWGLLMLALYRSGRQSEALRAFSRARVVLGELGLEPGTELRRLEAAILAQSPDLDWRRPPVAGEPVVTAARADLSRVVDRGELSGVAPHGTPPLIGRTEELAVLDRAFADACEGRGRLVLLAGEAGIGKTRLASEVATAASRHGAWTAWGRGTEVEGAPPSWFWTQVIRALLAAGEAEELRRALGPGAADIAQIVPEVAELAGEIARPWPTDPAAARFRLYEAVVAFLTRLAARRPLVLVLDDLQWADAPSLELTELLVQKLPDIPVLMVVTYREREAAAASAVPSTLGALARSPVLDRLPLGGLSEAEVGAFVTQATGVEPPGEVVGIVHARTEGNPFYVAELARSLAAEGALDDPATSGRQVPRGIREVLRRRLAALPDATRTLLGTAAVAGREFALATVAAACDVALGDAMEAVEAGVTAGLVDEDPQTAGGYRFSHVLVRDAMYDEIRGLDRARLHGRLGQALSDRDDGSLELVGELAHHLYLAAPVVGPDLGIPAAIRAAEAARAALAFEQAETHLRQAIVLVATMAPGDDRDRHELQLRLRLGFLISETRGHAWPEVAQMFDRAQHLCVGTGVTVDQLKTLWGRFAVAYMAGKLEGAAQVGEQLLDLGRRAEDSHCELAGLIAVGTSEFYLGRLVKARDHLAGAAAIADALTVSPPMDFYREDPRVASRTVLVNATWLLGHYDEAEAMAVDQMQRFEAPDHRRSHMAVLLSVGWLRFLQRDADRLAEGATTLRRLAVEMGHQPLELAASMQLGWAMAQKGETTAGASLVRRTLEALDAARMVALRPCLLGMLAEAELLDGRPDAALVTVDAGLAEVNRRGDRFYLPELHRLKGEIVLASMPDSADLARACFQQALEEAEAQGAVPFRDRALRSAQQLSPV